MALVKGTNSYADLAEAEAYFADRLDVAAWESATDPQKEQALVTATSILDDMSWTGIAASESQLTAFPRIGEYFDPRLGLDAFLDGVDIPDRIVKATYELAYHFLNNDGILDSTGAVDSISVGPIKLEGIQSSGQIPSNVLRMVKPLRTNGGSSVWWRAN
ncbi:hypothetical protein N9112_00105 [bacterium]|nr:hypothetical protein [bacterium]